MLKFLYFNLKTKSRALTNPLRCCTLVFIPVASTTLQHCKLGGASQKLATCDSGLTRCSHYSVWCVSVLRKRASCIEMLRDYCDHETRITAYIIVSKARREETETGEQSFAEKHKEGSNPGGGEIFRTLQTGSGAHPASSAGAKQPGYGVDHTTIYRRR